MIKSYTLSNGWIAEETAKGFFLEVKPIPNSIFSRNYKVVIPENIFNVIADGERNIEILTKKYRILHYAFVWGPAQRNKAPVNTEHKYFGGGWFVEEINDKYFLDYLLSANGGGSNRIEISKEIYLDARNGKMNLSEINAKYKLLL